ncbi:hypothetical protein DSL92_06120 [Billgrantia gudaonensis]|uniref:Uncharacterized protein n=1 Tax=Billgrantia gudaonensis TaxID=376427 RepID=A0A3S0NWW1_9GAMM|nr:hypothetical protein DSL92_06120 [Halomonas gudaonensis]
MKFTSVTSSNVRSHFESLVFAKVLITIGAAIELDKQDGLELITDEVARRRRNAKVGVEVSNTEPGESSLSARLSESTLKAVKFTILTVLAPTRRCQCPSRYRYEPQTLRFRSRTSHCPAGEVQHVAVFAVLEVDDGVLTEAAGIELDGIERSSLL